MERRIEVPPLKSGLGDFQTSKSHNHSFCPVLGSQVEIPQTPFSRGISISSRGVTSNTRHQPYAGVSTFFRCEAKLWASRRKEAALFLRNPTGGRVSRKKERLTQRRPFRLRRSRKNVETPILGAPCKSLVLRNLGDDRIEKSASVVSVLWRARQSTT